MLDGAGEGQRDLHGLRGQECVAQVLLVQGNAKAGLKITRQHHRSLGIENRASRESAFDGIEDDFGIESGLGGQRERFAHRRDIARHHDLIGELGHIAGSHGSGEGDAGAHVLENGLDFLECFRLAADHDGQCSLDGLGLAAADGGIQELDAFRRAGRADLLGNYGADGAHVDDD